MEIMNQARGYAYLYGVLKKQQDDPFCGSCNAFVNTLAAAKDDLGSFEREHAHAVGSLPAELGRLFSDAKNGITLATQPDKPLSQKKAGNCRLPEGVCFMKAALAVLQKI